MRTAPKTPRSALEPTTAEAWTAFVLRIEESRHYGFLLRTLAAGSVVGIVNVSDIIQGSFWSAHLSYYAFTGHEGRGLMTEGVRWADTTPPTEADNRSLILFDSGDQVEVQAGEEGIRFLLVSGKPLQEPVAWYGPIVMNTQQQLQQAYEEFKKGTFLKSSA